MARESIPYFKWRGGRPRWEPGPSLRARGFKGRDLKDASGEWLGRGAAISAADAINRQIGDGAAQSPSKSPSIKNSRAPRITVKPRVCARTIIDLFEQMKRSAKFSMERAEDEKGRKRRRIKKQTRDTYLSHMRIIEEWGGEVPVAALSLQTLENFYEKLIDTRGPSMANAIMRTFRLALNFAKDRLEWIDRNRVSQMEFEQVDGRRVIWSFEEIAAFIAAADASERPSLGDACVLAAITGLRLSDLLALQRLNVSGAVVQVRTSKTGKNAIIPVIRQLRERVTLAHARQEITWPGVTAATEIVNDQTGRPYVDRWRFSDAVRDVRAVAAQTVPSIADKTWADLRDTAVTWLFLAGCTDAEVAAIQGRSLASVKAVLDKHYFVRDPEFGATGGNKLELFLESRVKW